jgi:hypothetical protein
MPMVDLVSIVEAPPQLALPAGVWDAAAVRRNPVEAVRVACEHVTVTELARMVQASRFEVDMWRSGGLRPDLGACKRLGAALRALPARGAVAGAESFTGDLSGLGIPVSPGEWTVVAVTLPHLARQGRPLGQWLQQVGAADQPWPHLHLAVAGDAEQLLSWAVFAAPRAVTRTVVSEIMYTGAWAHAWTVYGMPPSRLRFASFVDLQVPSAGELRVDVTALAVELALGPHLWWGNLGPVAAESLAGRFARAMPAGR